jgi:hypothetical protein
MGKKAKKVPLLGIFRTFFVKNLEIPEKVANLVPDQFLLRSIHPFLRVLTNPFPSFDPLPSSMNAETI